MNKYESNATEKPNSTSVQHNSLQMSDNEVRHLATSDNVMESGSTSAILKNSVGFGLVGTAACAAAMKVANQPMNKVALTTAAILGTVGGAISETVARGARAEGIKAGYSQGFADAVDESRTKNQTAIEL